MGRIVLCADTDSLVHPFLLGLEDMSLEGREWLVPLSDAAEARTYIAGHADIDEVWIVSSDDLAGVNLAAAVRKDGPELPVYLVSLEASGSELSRAAQAGVTAVLTPPAFCERFGIEARRRALMDEIADVDIDEMLDDVNDARHAPSLPNTETIPLADGPLRSDAQSVPEVNEKPLGSGASALPKAPLPRVLETEADAAAPASVEREEEEPRAAIEPTGPSDAARRVLGREGNAFIASFLSGSGGVGKSTVAAVAAYRSAMRGLNTVVVDCDLQFGDLGQMMGSQNAMSVDDILSDPEAIDLLAQATPPDAPALVSAPSRLERSEDLGLHLGDILDICSSAFDVVLVNTGANWSENHAQLLERSAASIFLIDQRASSVHACRHALDLCMRLGIASGSFVYALNRCRRGALFTSIDIANVLQGAHVFEIKDGGAEVEELLGAGLAAELASTRNELCVSVDEMLDDLLPAGTDFAGVRARRKTVHERNRSRGRGPAREAAPAGGRGKSARRKTARAAR